MSSFIGLLILLLSGRFLLQSGGIVGNLLAPLVGEDDFGRMWMLLWGCGNALHDPFAGSCSAHRHGMSDILYHFQVQLLTVLLQ